MTQKNKEKTVRKWLTTNIQGQNVWFSRIVCGEKVWFTAYSDLEGSSHLSDRFLNYPTHREKDVVGVDTAHSWNEKQTEASKLADAISQIGEVITKWRIATDDNFCEEDLEVLENDK